MSEWTFLTNYAVVFSVLAQRPQITARELALISGITERTIRKYIADLVAAGYITKKKQGWGVRYDVNPDLPLRQPTFREVAVGQLLKSLGWKRRRKRAQVTVAAGAPASQAA